MTDTIGTTRRGDALAVTPGSLDEAIRTAWELGPTAGFTQDRMSVILDAMFSSTVRAVERHDRTLLGWLADKLTALAARLLRDLQPAPSLFFAAYVQALGDITHALSANDAALVTLHSQVKRKKHVLPLLAVLSQSAGPMTAGHLARRLSLEPNNLTNVIRSSMDAGIISCAVSGRQKLCSITSLGQSYLDEIEKPVTRLLSRRLVEQYWMLAMETPDDEACDAVVKANPAIPQEELQNLLTAAKRVDGFQVALADARARLAVDTEWHVLFKTASISREVLGQDTTGVEIRATVVENGDEYVRFRSPKGRFGVTEFLLPYRLLFKNDEVTVRRFKARRELDVLRPAGFDAIVRSVQHPAAPSSTVP